MKNNKGFLLAETIVTVCIIATLATSMYLYISKTASRFEDRNNYENVVDVYKINTLKEYLDNKNYLEISNASTNIISEANLGDIKDTLSINKAYLIKDTNNEKNELKNRISEQAFKDYLNWVTIEDSDNLRLIVWFNGEGDGTFANLRIIK